MHMADKQPKNPNTAAAGVAGAIIGAAATAAALTLSDKKKRQKFTNKVQELKKIGKEQLNKIKQASQDAQHNTAQPAVQATQGTIDAIEEKPGAASEKAGDVAESTNKTPAQNTSHKTTRATN